MYEPYTGPVAPLLLKKELCETNENIKRNIDRTLSSSYVRFNELLGSRLGKTISVVGSGPSVSRHYKEITGDVMACNAAHDYLIDRGIVPTYGMFFDASPIVADMITPHKDVTYLLASRCHADVFEKLRDYKVVVWHCKGDPYMDEALEGEFQRMEPMIHGGSAAVLRSLFIAHVMGYAECHMFGVDSSFEGDVTHIKEYVPETMIDIYVVGKWFKTTAWMCGQVEDFKDLAQAMSERIKMVIHGEGMLPCLAKAMGYDVISIEQEPTQSLEETPC